MDAVRAGSGPRWLDRATTLAFLALLAAPAIDVLARPVEARDVRRENRLPAPWPPRPLDLPALGHFPERFEEAFGDRFGLRDVMIAGAQVLKLFVFAHEPSPTMVVGTEGWLYFGADDSVRVRRGIVPLEHAELEHWRRGLEDRRDWLRDRGIEYVFALAPNKDTIYPDCYPRALSQVAPTRLEQLEAHMRSRSDVRIVDLRPALLAEREHDRDDSFAYHRLGSHWTDRGARAAAEAILRELAVPFPAMAPLPRDAFEEFELPASASDTFGDQMYIGGLLHQRVVGVRPREPVPLTFEREPERGQISVASTGDPSLPRVVFMHDSFGPAILPFLAARAQRVRALWEHGFSKEVVESEKPDVVVQLLTERMLVWGLPPFARDVERIDRARFDTGAPLWGPLDPARVEVAGRARIERAEDGAALLAEDGSALLVLPASEVPDSAMLGLRLDVTIPSTTVLDVFYQLESERTFSRVRMVQLSVEAGRRELCFVVPVRNIVGPLRVRLGQMAGRYLVHALEARAVPR